MKKLIIFIILFTITLNVNASTNVRDRNQLDNLGVNKHFDIIDKNKNIILKTYSVNANEKIYDFSEKLTDEEEYLIYNNITNFIEKANMDLIFVTANIPYNYNKQNEEFATDFYNYNDFGIDKEKYSGIMLFMNTYENKPYFDIYLFGNAQLYFDQTRRNDILNSINYYLYYEKYVQGVNLFIDKITYYYNEGVPATLQNYTVDDDGLLTEVYQTPWLEIIIFSFLIALLRIILIIKKNKMINHKLDVSHYITPTNIHITKAYNKLVDVKPHI